MLSAGSTGTPLNASTSQALRAAAAAGATAPAATLESGSSHQGLVKSLGPPGAVSTQSACTRERPVTLDVGGNIGLFAVAAGAYGCTVLSSGAPHDEHRAPVAHRQAQWLGGSGAAIQTRCIPQRCPGPCNHGLLRCQAWPGKAGSSAWRLAKRSTRKCDGLPARCVWARDCWQPWTLLTCFSGRSRSPEAPFSAEGIGK